jgi:hypothetical protein
MDVVRGCAVIIRIVLLSDLLDVAAVGFPESLKLGIR